MDAIDCSVIIKVLSAVLSRLIETNQQQAPGQHLLTKFQSSYTPEVSIHGYLERIKKYARCSDCCFIIALIYIDRLIEIRNVVLTALNVHRLIIASLMLSAKFFDDLFYNNAFYAKLGGVTVREINSLEIELLSLLNFSLFVTSEQYAKYHTELRNYAGATASPVAFPLNSRGVCPEITPEPSHSPSATWCGMGPEAPLDMIRCVTKKRAACAVVYDIHPASAQLQPSSCTSQLPPHRHAMFVPAASCPQDSLLMQRFSTESHGQLGIGLVVVQPPEHSANWVCVDRQQHSVPSESYVDQRGSTRYPGYPQAAPIASGMHHAQMLSRFGPLDVHSQGQYQAHGNTFQPLAAPMNPMSPVAAAGSGATFPCSPLARLSSSGSSSAASLAASLTASPLMTNYASTPSRNMSKLPLLHVDAQALVAPVPIHSCTGGLSRHPSQNLLAGSPSGPFELSRTLSARRQGSFKDHSSLFSPPAAPHHLPDAQMQPPYPQFSYDHPCHPVAISDYTSPAKYARSGDSFSADLADRFDSATARPILRNCPSHRQGLPSFDQYTAAASRTAAAMSASTYADAQAYPACYAGTNQHRVSDTMFNPQTSNVRVATMMRVPQTRSFDANYSIASNARSYPQTTAMRGTTQSLAAAAFDTDAALSAVLTSANLRLPTYGEPSMFGSSTSYCTLEPPMPFTTNLQQLYGNSSRVASSAHQYNVGACDPRHQHCFPNVTYGLNLTVGGC